MARKTKYEDDFPARAEDYARQGMIDKEIAKKLGISEKVFYDYQTKYPQFLQAIKRGKAPVDFEVENILLKKVRGFEYDETHIEYKDLPVKGKDKPKPTSVKRIKKLVIPSDTAIIFWLKNRRPKKWRDKQNVELTGEDGESIKIEYVPVKKKENDNKTG